MEILNIITCQMINIQNILSMSYDKNFKYLKTGFKISNISKYLNHSLFSDHFSEPFSEPLSGQAFFNKKKNSKEIPMLTRDYGDFRKSHESLRTVEASKHFLKNKNREADPDVNTQFW